MLNRVFSFIIGILLTASVAGVAHFYLKAQNNKKGFETQNAAVDLLETLDLRFTDLKYKFFPRKPSAADVVLVAVDDASLREVGRWPWSRDVVADVTQKLMDYGVKAVGMDVIWSEPEKGAPENDQKMADVVAKNAGRIVLGTFSDDGLKLLPYQDYCVNEAFLATGGNQIVKLNPSFVLDDSNDNFEMLDWGVLFKPLFKNIQDDVEKQYLSSLKKTSVDELGPFQKNFLAAAKNQQIFSYCEEWLTPKDHLFSDPDHRETIKLLLRQLFDNSSFDKKDEYANLSVEGAVARFKSEVVDLPIPQYGQWQANIPVIQEQGSYTGSFLAFLDLDGYVRRYPMFFRSGNKVGVSFIPSLPMQTYLAATGYRADVKVDKVGDQKKISSFQIIDASGEQDKVVQNIPVDSQGRLLVNYYGPTNTLPYVSAKDLFLEDGNIFVQTYDHHTSSGQVYLKQISKNKKEFFKDKTVILGVTSVAVYDLRNTPVAANFPGPEIHLTLLSNLFEQNYIKRLPKEENILPLVILLLGIGLTAILTFVGAFRTIVCLMATLAIGFVADKYVFEKLNYIVSSFFVFGEIMGVHFSMLFYKYFSEERKRSELRRTFSKYVSPAVVDELLKNEDNLKLGGRKQDMSVFFSDVRGFTEFSEKMDPQELSQFLNEYLTPMTEMIFKNKGTLDKYMGDGVMAFFGAPVPYPDHAYYACLCALDSLEMLKKLQIEFDRKKWPKLDMGMGINTGFMSVGNMGSKIVQSYTVIGDAVNLGSRLESANKEYGTRILISETTYEQVKGKFVMREVDLVRVKGKKEPIRAYELIAPTATQEMRDWIELYEKAYHWYHARQFAKAKEIFSKIETLYPFDMLSKMYIGRCNEFLAEPPAAEWDGVFAMKAK